VKTTRALGALGAILLAGAMIAGCAPAIPESLGLGGSDEQLVEPSDTSDAVSGDAEEADAADGTTDALGDLYPASASFNYSLRGFPAGTKLVWKRDRANCVRDEYEGSFAAGTNPWPTVMTISTSGSCLFEYSYARWWMTALLPNGQSLMTNMIIETRSGSSAFDVKVYVNCDAGSFTCEYHESTHQDEHSLPFARVATTFYPVATPPGADWVLCAPEGGECPADFKLAWVKFGTNGKFTPAQLNARTSSCTTAGMGGVDPAPNEPKACWVANNPG